MFGSTPSPGSNTLPLLKTHDLAVYGRVWALRMGPFGTVLAMTWDTNLVGA